MDEHSMENLELFGQNGDGLDGRLNGSNSPSQSSLQENEQMPEEETSNGHAPSRSRRKPIQRSFPAVPFEEALIIPMAIQQFASGLEIRRVTLFDKLQRSPDSGTSRQLITNSSRYGLTTGSYAAEWLRLTEDGGIVTSEDAPEREKIRVRLKLAIEQIAPFKRLYDHLIGGRLPDKSVMVDFLKNTGMKAEEASECVDTFLLNAKYVGVIRSLAGAERVLSLDHVLDAVSPVVQQSPSQAVPQAATPVVQTVSATIPSTFEASSGKAESQWDRVCFYITPIGEDGSEQRMHSDLFLGQILEPALEEFDLTVVRADRIATAGMITRQIIEHILRARIVVADLLFHNPNVFYELALRHACGLPTVHITRACDRIPFDVNQVRTITIDTTSIYTLVPQLNVYRSAITSHVRRALEAPESIDNPVSVFYPLPKVRQQ
jgi:hypothetical protein